jgi:hypothetical protein
MPKLLTKQDRYDNKMKAYDFSRKFFWVHRDDYADLKAHCDRLMAARRKMLKIS